MEKVEVFIFQIVLISSGLKASIQKLIFSNSRGKKASQVCKIIFVFLSLTFWMFKNFFCISINLFVFMFLLAMEDFPRQTIPILFFFLRLSMGVPFYNFFKVLFWLKRWTISDNYSFQKTLDYKKPSQMEKYQISQETENYAVSSSV